MNLVFGGISEGTFAFFIIFCTLVGMLTGAYLMDKDRFVYLIRERWYSILLFNLVLAFYWKRVAAILQNLFSSPSSFSCIFNRHDYRQRSAAVSEDEYIIIYKCIRCGHFDWERTTFETSD